MDVQAYSFSGLLELGSSAVTFESDFCTRVRHRRSGCTKCADACPSGAISYDGKRFHADSDLCTGCGACESACPTGALKNQMPDSDHDRHRRFSFPKVGDDGSLPHRVPSFRLAELEELNGSAARPADSENLDCTRWRHIDIDVGACISCRRCAVFCPTGSLRQFHTRKGLIGVKHDPSTCTACGLCADQCQKGALRLVGGVTAGQIRTGEIDRIVLNPPKFEKSGPHAMTNALKRYITVDQVAEMA